jgi:Helix-turn-helix domain
MRNLPPVLGVTEVMVILDKSQHTVLRLARSGELVGRKLGDGRTASWAFTGESVAAYLERIELREERSA